MVKKGFLLLASAFLIWQSYMLLSGIGEMGEHSWGVSLFIAWITNMFLTGIFAFAGFALPTQRLLPASYYRVRNPKRLKKAYSVFGVGGFRKFLLFTFWRGEKQRQKYFDGTREGLPNLVEQSQKSEFGHLVPFLILTIVSIYLTAAVSVRVGILTMLINVLGNFYPILLQRHHRMRIAALARLQRRRKSTGSVERAS